MRVLPTRSRPRSRRDPGSVFSETANFPSSRAKAAVVEGPRIFFHSADRLFKLEVLWPARFRDSTLAALRPA